MWTEKNDGIGAALKEKGEYGRAWGTSMSNLWLGVGGVYPGGGG